MSQCQHKRVYQCLICNKHVCHECGVELPYASRELLSIAKICATCNSAGKSLFSK